MYIYVLALYMYGTIFRRQDDVVPTRPVLLRPAQLDQPLASDSTRPVACIDLTMTVPCPRHNKEPPGVMYSPIPPMDF